MHSPGRCRDARGGVLEFLGSMTKPRVHELADNLLGGQLPPTLSQFWRLRRVDFKDAGLVSVVLPEPGKFMKLQFFDLSMNWLIGALPASLAGMRSMREFDISSKKFAGLEAKAVVPLPQQNLTGPIQPKITEMANPEKQDLSPNLLTRSIPSSFDSLKNLKMLTLNGNELSGTIPPEIGNMSALQKFDVDTNKLEG
ncbi:hypothetical protein EJB05_42915, partial [Eragrostis curvula]